MKFASSKRLALAASAVVMALATPVATLAAGFTPANRPTYTWSGVSTKAANHVVFNSFTNMPGYGDERVFFMAKPSNASDSSYRNILNVVPGQEVTMRVYIHNNADAKLNESGKGIATNTRVRIAIPTSSNSSLPVTSYISADNANNNVKDANGAVNVISDTLNLNNSSTPVSISYVPGSAMIYNGAHTGGLKLNDAIVGANGTQVGYDKMNGKFPGCSHYRATVTIKVRVNAPGLSLNKQVTIPGSTEWQKSLVASPGNTLSWMLTVSNTSQSAPLTSIVVTDKLPAHLQLIPGSVTYFSTTYPNGKAMSDTELFTSGAKLPNFAPRTTAYVRYRTTVKNDFSSGDCAAVLSNGATAKAAGVKPVASNATASINTCATPVTPALPDTGASMPLAAALGLTGLGYGIWYYRRSRLSLRTSLRK